MPVTIPVHPTRPVIKYRGVVDFHNLLRTLRQAIIDQGYTFYESGHEYKMGENGAELKISWEGTRKISGFLRYSLHIFIFAREYRDIDFVKDGQKIVLQQTRMLIEFQGTLDLDYNRTFEKSKLLLAVREFLLNYVWRKKVTGTWGDDLYYTIYKLHRIAKECLNMESITDSSRYRVL